MESIEIQWDAGFPTMDGMKLTDQMDGMKLAYQMDGMKLNGSNGCDP